MLQGPFTFYTFLLVFKNFLCFPSETSVTSSILGLSSVLVSLLTCTFCLFFLHPGILLSNLSTDIFTSIMYFLKVSFSLKKPY